MIFEVGKTYQHKGTKEKILIIAKSEISNTYFTPMLIGEKQDGTLCPIGIGEDYSVNWEEVID